MPDKDTVDEVDELIQRRTQVEVPAELEERLQYRLAEFRTRIEQRPAGRFRTLASSLMHQPALRMAAMAAALLLAVTVGLIFVPREGRASQVFAAAAAQLRNSQSLAYTIVLNAEPWVAVDFSYLAPGYRRLNCSWGIEVRTDGTTGRQLVLMHASRTYLTEGGKQVESRAVTENFAEQLRSLPQTADEALGEQWASQKKLVGYRLHKPPNGTIPGLKGLDIWIDATTREADHVDITVQEAGKPAHQMHIQNIRVDGQVDRSLFDLTPPAGYTPIITASSGPGAGGPAPASSAVALRAQLRQSSALTAVVMPMHGSYAQTRYALYAVDYYLKTLSVTPTGPPFGRYESEGHWDAGYPVPPGIHVKAPFQLISLPEASTAFVVIKGAWATDSTPRWAAFLKSVAKLGYAPVGPPMETWSGDAAQPATQSTEMRIPVTRVR